LIYETVCEWRWLRTRTNFHCCCEGLDLWTGLGAKGFVDWRWDAIFWSAVWSVDPVVTISAMIASVAKTTPAGFDFKRASRIPETKTATIAVIL
jgi:hypothetical protein